MLLDGDRVLDGAWGDACDPRDPVAGLARLPRWQICHLGVLAEVRKPALATFFARNPVGVELERERGSLKRFELTARKRREDHVLDRVGRVDDPYRHRLEADLPGGL